MKITKKIVIMFAAVLLILAPTAVTVFAQPTGMPGIAGERGYARSIVEPVLMGHGFAINPSNESQYHILDVTAITAANISSSTIRSLLSENKTRAEIATDIRNYIQNAPTTAKGDLWFAGQAYALDVTNYNNQSLTGNVMTLPPRGTNYSTFTPTNVGSISLSLSDYEGALVSTGTLTMNSTTYNVLLTSPVMPSRGGMFGMGGYGNGMHGMGVSGSHNNNGILGRIFGVFGMHNPRRG